MCLWLSLQTNWLSISAGGRQDRLTQEDLHHCLEKAKASVLATRETSVRLAIARGCKGEEK